MTLRTEGRPRAIVTGMATPFRFDRTWQFPIPPAELWTVLNRTDDYVDWWSWLREFDSEGLRAGAVARCTIQSPLPYSLRCRIRIEALRAPHSIDTMISGDLRGPARLEIRPAGSGSAARLVWSVALANPVLAGLSRVARPAMAWAHDQVVSLGAEQFRRRALTETEATNPDGIRDPATGR